MSTLWEAVLKFVLAALFGCLVTLVVILAILGMGLDSFWASRWVHILWIIPLLWGCLGVIWFDRVLELGRDVFEGYFNGHC